MRSVLPPELRVLVVDDERGSLAALAAVISLEHKTMATVSAKEALDILGKFQPHVLCTDFSMSEMDGLDLLAHAKARLPSLQGVIVTGYHDYLDTIRSRSRDMIVVFKPYQPKALLSAISSAGQMCTLASPMKAVAR